MNVLISVDNETTRQDRMLQLKLAGKLTTRDKNHKVENRGMMKWLDPQMEPEWMNL